MARKNFGSLLETIAEQAEPPVEPQKAPTPRARADKKPSAKKSAPKPAPSTVVAAEPDIEPDKVSAEKIEPEVADQIVAEEPKAGGVGYEKLHVKAARIHDLQNDALVEIARDLNRARKGQGHRITENTLIRLALDLLIKHRDDLHGTTEAELAASLKL